MDDKLIYPYDDKQNYPFDRLKFFDEKFSE